MRLFPLRLRSSLTTKPPEHPQSNGAPPVAHNPPLATVIHQPPLFLSFSPPSFCVHSIPTAVSHVSLAHSIPSFHPFPSRTPFLAHSILCSTPSFCPSPLRTRSARSACCAHLTRFADPPFASSSAPETPSPTSVSGDGLRLRGQRHAQHARRHALPQRPHPRPLPALRLPRHGWRRHGWHADRRLRPRGAPDAGRTDEEKERSGKGGHGRVGRGWAVWGVG